MNISNLIIAALASSALATGANADGFYAGFGVGYTSADSDAGGPAGSYGTGSSKLQAGIAGVTAGYRWDLQNGFAAAEFDSDFSLSSNFKNTLSGASCSVGATGAYYCTHDATVRLRGLYGAPVGNGWELYGALGLGLMSGKGATNTFTTDNGMNAGVTLGLGAQRQFGMGKARFEVTYDSFDSTINKPSSATVSYEPSYKATSVKLSYLFAF